LSQHALLVDVATKVLADNLTALLNRAVPMAPHTADGLSRQVNRAAASKMFSRCWTRHTHSRANISQKPPFIPSLIPRRLTSERLKFGGMDTQAGISIHGRRFLPQNWSNLFLLSFERPCG
jgi:hypothetical protein